MRGRKRRSAIRVVLVLHKTRRRVHTVSEPAVEGIGIRKRLLTSSPELLTCIYLGRRFHAHLVLLKRRLMVMITQEISDK